LKRGTRNAERGIFVALTSVPRSAFRIPRLNSWVATVPPRALRFKRPLHRCNACNPELVRQPGVAPGRSVWKTVMLLFNITTAKNLESRRGDAPRASGLQPAPFACSVAGRL